MSVADQRLLLPGMILSDTDDQDMAIASLSVWGGMVAAIREGVSPWIDSKTCCATANCLTT